MAGRRIVHEDFAASREPIPCGMGDCLRPALARVRGAEGGWMNLCPYHYERQHQGAAREYAAQHGLVTAKDHAAHCGALSRKIARKWRMREPGEEG